MSHYVTDKDGNLIEVAGNYTPEEIEMFLTAHPIGSYFISQYSISPAELYGGGWEEIDAGKTLWTIPTTETGAGETIEAGLPEIEGGFRTFLGTQTPPTQAFEQGTVYTNASNISGGSNNNYPLTWVRFYASNSNDIYGKSSTVQPPAIKVYMWRRYA